ncbi:EAL domain-containing protein [Thiomicrospira microaerophila]|uniref:EAL and HDOD domain-containing protein n=1 Tax=Thiomicrospira microaerophila TaxID=406020 RepID=UPI00200DE116|nr:EAL domain-containing protein [Thiomicrospira microaerophila]UQB42382.1 EAL domain-containing protein [Thiomicrospira microaerophila]
MPNLIDVFVGRQPVFDKELKTFAYELLFRANREDNHAVIVGGDSASAQVMIHAFGDIGIKDIAGEHKVFINFTEGLLLREYQPFFPKSKVVIEILETVRVTPSLLSAVKKLRESGYVIALDDYVFNSQLECLEPLADIIKVDILRVGPRQLIEHVKRLKEQGAKLLAEKVETQAHFEFCKKIGFDYFQGYFFAKPVIIQGQRLPTNKVSVLELLASVYDPDVDMQKLSDIISRDVSLSQKLLKFLAQNLEGNHKISSIHDAVVRFGLNRLKSWASMLVLSGVDDKPEELFQTSLTRAKYCELVAEKLAIRPKELYFTVGLFSAFDALMDQDLEVLLAKLNLDEVIFEALMTGKNMPGIILQSVKGLERGETDFTLPGDCTPADLSHCYLQAMQFTQTVVNG